MDDWITAEKRLGSPGKLLSASKQARGRDIWWNACVFNQKREQIWYGDIDFDKDRHALFNLAEDLKNVIYVTREQPYRFEGLSRREAKEAERNENERVKSYL